jgi:hypothetical protein
MPGGFSLVDFAACQQFVETVLWFVQGHYHGEFNNDLVRANGPPEVDKLLHRYGQNENAVGSLIERFTYAGEVILDPFIGGGVTVIAALRLGRRCIGADGDPAAVLRPRLADQLERVGVLRPPPGDRIVGGRGGELERLRACCKGPSNLL